MSVGAFAHLLEKLSSFYLVSPLLAVSFRDCIVERNFRKGKELLERGKRQQVVYFLYRGTAKEVSLIRGQGSRVSWFWYASDFLFAYPGFFSREPAMASIELVEDSELLEISYTDLVMLMERFPELPILIERLRSYYERLRHEHGTDMASLSARERYHKFYGQHKNLFNIAKHKDIASFLGIKDNGFHRYQ